MRTKIEVKVSYQKRLREYFACCYYKLDNDLIQGAGFHSDKNTAIETATKDLQEKIKFIKEHPTNIIEVDLDI